jgi:hypothetical protein
MHANLVLKGISKIFKCIGNYFNSRTIFKTKCTLRGILMKTWPVRDAQQKKQCVYNIPSECGRWYIGEASMKEHKYNLTQGLIEKSKLAQHAYEGHEICWNEAKVLQTEPNTTHRRKKGICPHVSDSPSDQSTQLGHLSHLDSCYHSRSKKTTTPSSVDWVR